MSWRGKLPSEDTPYPPPTTTTTTNYRRLGEPQSGSSSISDSPNSRRSERGGSSKDLLLSSDSPSSQRRPAERAAAASLLVCPLCRQDYNAAERAPYVLFPCGCTLCAACLANLTHDISQSTPRTGGGGNHHVCCPVVSGHQAFSDSCLNLALARMVLDSCPHHPGQALRYFCPDDNSPMCKDCCILLHNQHDGPLSLEDGRARMHELGKGLIDQMERKVLELDSFTGKLDKVRDAVGARRSVMEEGIHAVADEAMNAMLATRDRLLHELAEASNKRDSTLKSQIKGLQRAMEGLEVTRRELDTAFLSGRILDVTESVAALQQALGRASKVELEPVMEDDLEYRGPSEAERKEALARLNGEGQDDLGPARLWGVVSKRPLSRLIGCVGSMGPGPRQFMHPRMVAVDDEFLFVADCDNHRVIVLDKRSLKPMAMMNTSDDNAVGGLQLPKPNGVAVDEKRLYVTEHQGHSVRAFDKITGAEIWMSGSGVAGSGQEDYNHPWGVVVDNEYCYVADYVNFRIIVIRKEDGQHVRVIATLRELGNPLGVTLDPENPQHLYVSCNRSHRVVVLDKETGGPIRSFGVPGQAGSDNAHFYNPRGVAVLGPHLYITDGGNHRVQVLDKNTGSYVATLGTSGQAGEGEGHFIFPYGLVVDGKRLFVSEYGSHRIQVFKA